MSVHKVPQDVEAEDKLIGPFGFRQFAYLAIAGFLIFLGYLFFRIYPLLALAPLPFVGFLVLLALPLRKDQPMEIYLLALLRFYMKPKRRLWNPDGTVTYVEITAPKVVEEALPVKGLTQEAAEQRLDYLARVMDSRGWAIKGVVAPNANANITPTVAAESYGVTDIMDDQAAVARSFDDLLAKKSEENRQNALNRMRGQTAQPPRPRFARNPYDDVLQRQFMPDDPPPGPRTASYAAAQTGYAAPGSQPPQPPQPIDAGLGQPPAPAAFGPAPRFNPYPADMHQKVIAPYGAGVAAGGPGLGTDVPPVPGVQPAGADVAGAAPASALGSGAPQKPDNPTQKPMAQTVSPDIIRLASNTDLSISAIANEARRLEENQDGEVFIKLR